MVRLGNTTNLQVRVCINHCGLRQIHLVVGCKDMLYCTLNISTSSISLYLYIFACKCYYSLMKAAVQVCFG